MNISGGRAKTFRHCRCPWLSWAKTMNSRYTVCDAKLLVNIGQLLKVAVELIIGYLA